MGPPEGGRAPGEAVKSAAGHWAMQRPSTCNKCGPRVTDGRGVCHT